MKRLTIFALLLASVIFLACSCFLTPSAPKAKNTTPKTANETPSKTEGNSMNNIRNFGYCDLDGDFLYCNLETKLYKISISTGERTKISDDFSPGFINVSKGWIYYVSYERAEPKQEEDGVEYIGKGQINKIKTDGTGKKMLAEVENGTIMLVLDDKIYYDTDTNEKDGEWSGLFSMSLDGGKKERIAMNINNINIVDGWIYYFKSGEDLSDFCKMKLDGTEKTKLAPQNLTASLLFTGGYNIVGDSLIYNEKLYASRPNDNWTKVPVYKFSLDLKTKTEAVKDVACSLGGDVTIAFNIDNDFIYYFGNPKEENVALYRKNLTDNSLEKLAEDVPANIINIFSDKLVLVGYPSDSEGPAMPYYYVLNKDGSGLKEL